MSGIKAQISIPANTQTVVYAVPSSTIGVFKTVIRNKTMEKAAIKIWHTDGTAAEENKTYEDIIEKGIILSGDILSNGQKIIIEATKDMHVTIMAMEEIV